MWAKHVNIYRPSALGSGSAGGSAGCGAAKAVQGQYRGSTRAVPGQY